MNARNKVMLVLAISIIGLVTLACACPVLSSLTATATPVPPPTAVPEPMRGLVGTWRDNAEGTNHTIAWDGHTYHVTNSVNDDGSINDITSESWNGSVFSFDYYVRASGVTVTINCTSVSGSSMYLTWSSTNGNSGTDIFVRQ
jgi:hypothetical protein